MVFLIDLSPEAVLSVKVDGTEMDGSDYEIRNEDGTAIILKNQYIKGLAAKSYQLAVEYGSGTVIETEFVIKEKPVEPEEDTDDVIPETEDDIVVPNTGVINEETTHSRLDTTLLSIFIGILVGVVSGFVLIRHALKD